LNLIALVVGDGRLDLCFCLLLGFALHTDYFTMWMLFFQAIAWFVEKLRRSPCGHP
jgi:hypothetical protein